MKKKISINLDTPFYKVFKPLFELNTKADEIYLTITKECNETALLTLFNDIKSYYEGFKPFSTLENSYSIWSVLSYVNVVNRYRDLTLFEGYHLPNDIYHGEYLWFNDSDVFKYRYIKELYELINKLETANTVKSEKRQVPGFVSLEIKKFINKKSPFCSTYLEYLWLEISKPNPNYIESTIHKDFMKRCVPISIKTLQGWTKGFRSQLSNEIFRHEAGEWEKIVQYINKL